jgi:hypothetical protein
MKIIIIHEGGNRWRWKLLWKNGHPAATAPRTYTRQGAINAAERVADAIEAASAITVEIRP